MAVFERDILLDLERWANDTNRKPLVLRGARQVGKTSIVNTFGKRFDNYLYVNLEDQMTKRFFEESISVSALLDLLFSFLNKPKKDGRTLLFIDEIQILLVLYLCCAISTNNFQTYLSLLLVLCLRA